MTMQFVCTIYTYITAYINTIVHVACLSTSRRAIFSSLLILMNTPSSPFFLYIKKRRSIISLYRLLYS